MIDTDYFMEEIMPYVLKKGNRKLSFQKFIDVVYNPSGDEEKDRNNRNRFISKYFATGNSIVSTSGDRDQRTIMLDQAILFVYLTERNPETLKLKLVDNLFKDI